MWKTKKLFCHVKLLKNTLINFYFIIIALPEVDAENGENAVDPDRYSPFFYLWIICSISSSLYAYTWDIKMDWGLLDRYLRICFLMSLSHPQMIFSCFAFLQNYC